MTHRAIEGSKSNRAAQGRDYPNEVATAIASSGTDFPFMAGPIVTSDAVYFTQVRDEPTGPGTSRYIFRAPLPE